MMNRRELLKQTIAGAVGAVAAAVALPFAVSPKPETRSDLAILMDAQRKIDMASGPDKTVLGLYDPAAGRFHEIGDMSPLSKPLTYADVAETMRKHHRAELARRGIIRS